MPRITRRDLFVAAIAAAATLAGVAGASPRGAVLSSTVFDWTAMNAQPNKTGSVRKVVQMPTATLDELEIHITTLNPGETPHAPHKHPDEELLIVKEGTVESLVNGELKRVGPGSVIFQAANQLHSIRNVGAVPATYHVIKWNSPGMLKK
ncbi:MAG TPA: cupin domain-containing protein [Vicinamibacterales bacterium]|jgi:quercetin dioxygenase-like cupin family protein|nr:cupin domain-containing protein [Vicinamibacterales bacterium]